MKITANTVLGYARTHGDRPAPHAPEVTGSATEITSFIAEKEGQFYNEALFVDGRKVVYPRLTQVLWELEHDGSTTVRLDGEEVNMEAIYTDREQCQRFDIPYFDSGELVIAADTLLQSKGGDGYGSEHTEFLSKFGSDTLVLSRTDSDPIGPGWWRVEVLREPR